MKTTEYIGLAMRTNRWDNDHIRERLTTDMIHVLHAGIGICTEIDELYNSGNDRVNQMEEIGDFFWYAALMCAVFGIEWDDMVSMAEPHEASGNPLHWLNEPVIITCEASQIADLIKKSIFYGKPLDKQSVLIRLAILVRSCEKMLSDCGFTVEQAMERNIAKLFKRFPEKFNDTDATVRNLSEERRALEGQGE